VKKTVCCAVVFVAQLLFANVLPAADPVAPIAPGRHVNVMRVNEQSSKTVEDDAASKMSGEVSPEGKSGWLRASFTTEAFAKPSEELAAPDDLDSPEVPLSTGAWFMGLGLVVFIISRDRFKP